MRKVILLNLLCLNGRLISKCVLSNKAQGSEKHSFGFGPFSLSLSLLVQGRQSVLLFVERANVFPENPLAMRIAVMMMTM